MILFGKEYWGGLIDWMRERVLGANNVKQEDIDTIRIVDDPERVRDIVVEFHEQAVATKGKEE